jgi:microcystin-dependent protein
MADPYLGEIRMFAGNFAPSGWALCNGQLISIQQNTALFSLLGTYYGGDGVRTFGLPNFQGVVPMNWGTSPGGTQYVIGETGGVENVTLSTNQMPMHNHTVGVSNQGGASVDPTNGFVAEINSGTPRQPATTTPAFNPSATGTMAPNAVSVAGGSQPHENRQPYLAVSFIIALQGIFPSRG